MKYAPMFAAVAALTVVVSTKAVTVVDEMAKAANALLADLDDKKKMQAVFKFKGEERTYWHFIPAEMLKGGGRKGFATKAE